MEIILVPGLWLRGDSWSGVERELAHAGHRVQSLTLPGQGDGWAEAVLQDHLDLVLAAVDAAGAPTLVVGHSAATTLAWMVADARPRAVAGVVMIGGMPVGDGRTYANFFPTEDGLMPFPGWGSFRGADVADLDEQARRYIESSAAPVPEGVCLASVVLSDGRRFAVPVTLVCAGYSPTEAQEWIDDGFVPELTRAERLTLVDIDSGHWPMLTKPHELARIIDGAARGQHPTLVQ